MSTKTTLELVHGDKISHLGIVREVDGVLPDGRWKFGKGRQPYIVRLRFLRGNVNHQIEDVMIDREFHIVDGEVGSLAPYSTVPAPRTRLYDPEGEMADRVADHQQTAMAGRLW